MNVLTGVAHLTASSTNAGTSAGSVRTRSRNPDLAAYYREWQTNGVNLFATGLKKSGYKNSKGLALTLLNLIRGFLLECLTDPTLTAQDFKKQVQIILSSKLRTDKD